MRRERERDRERKLTPPDCSKLLGRGGGHSIIQSASALKTLVTTERQTMIKDLQRTQQTQVQPRRTSLVFLETHTQEPGVEVGVGGFLLHPEVDECFMASQQALCSASDAATIPFAAPHLEANALKRCGWVWGWRGLGGGDADTFTQASP